MFKKIAAAVLTFVMVFGCAGCAERYDVSDLPQHSQKEFEISGFWAPYEISEESFSLYKDAGLNTLAMINHSLDNTSDDQFYLGSNRTMKALEICKKLGLKAILNYNDWKAEQCEGEDYNGETPFSKYDLYGDYKDIISGVHICDEPAAEHMIIYSNKTLIDDFKKVYPNASYIVNIVPITAGASAYGYVTYQNLVDDYAEKIMSQFENSYISVDYYPFHKNVKDEDLYIFTNYQMIAETAKKYNAKTNFILQSSTSAEFQDDLSEADMRWQVYSALAFGADTLQYYCYSEPQSFNEDGTVNYMYDRCILNQDGTPSDLYYYIKEINSEIQSFASVILSYDWDYSIGILGEKSTTRRLGAAMYNEFENPKHYVSATASRELLISRFTSEEYGEAYMFVNFADRDDNNTAEVTFKDCKKVAIYGGEDYAGTPQIIKLDENGKFTFELNYGEGVFIVPVS